MGKEDMEGEKWEGEERRVGGRRERGKKGRRREVRGDGGFMYSWCLTCT